MRPSLPQQDQDPSARRARLEQARAAYQFDHSFEGYALVAEVPKSAQFDRGYMLDAAEHALRLAGNHGASSLSGWLEHEVDAAHEAIVETFARADPAKMADAHAKAQQVVGGALGDARPGHPLSIEDYERLYTLLPRPASLPHWREDWFFAWQRVAGCNPILIERCRRLPDHFPVTQAHVERSLPGVSLAGALAEGRAFLVDYPMMAEVPVGSTDGMAKYLSAPMSLFISTPSGLHPVAIQCAQKPGPEAPIYTPADGFAWQMAKTAVQVADANFQGIVSHLGYCHLVMESTIIAAERQLAESHPLKVLLTPHFEFTLATNDVAKRQLIGPGGNTERLQSGTLQGSTDLVQGCLARYEICRTDAPTAFADRGVDDLEALPEYPFRDDALSSYGPIHRFADAYVRLYYSSAEDVAGDAELHAWVREMGAADGGKLYRVAPDGVNTVEDVVMLLTRILYTCTTYHSAINYASFDFMGYPPNMPAAAWGPGPAPSVEASDVALRRMMTPLTQSFGTIHLMWTIMMTRNHLGRYPPLHFSDRRVRPLVKQLDRDLKAAELEIQARNQSRRIPYTYVLPSLVPASIHV